MGMYSEFNELLGVDPQVIERNEASKKDNGMSESMTEFLQTKRSMVEREMSAENINARRDQKKDSEKKQGESTKQVHEVTTQESAPDPRQVEARADVVAQIDALVAETAKGDDDREQDRTAETL